MEERFRCYDNGEWNTTFVLSFDLRNSNDLLKYESLHQWMTIIKVYFSRSVNNLSTTLRGRASEITSLFVPATKVARGLSVNSQYTNSFGLSSLCVHNSFLLITFSL